MQTVPLCVDLDGTLIKSDSLFEAFVVLLKTRPFFALFLLFLLFRGKSCFKQHLAERVKLDILNLPYSKSFLTFLQNEHQNGRKLILITATHQKIAGEIAQHLGIFTEVIASDHRTNMKGKVKTGVLNSKFGKNNYDYAGNHKVDNHVWTDSRHALLVNASSSLTRQAKLNYQVSHTFNDKKFNFFTFLRALRLHQWVKNFLVFVPIFLGHLYFDVDAIKNIMLAFFAFCCVSSSVYLLNDLVDLEADRKHATKCARPFAAGDLSLSVGLFTFPILTLIGFYISLFLPSEFLITLATYYVLTLLYSFYLKRLILIDVFTLAVLYTLRIIAGMAVVDVGYSEWLISFSIFFFLSLAFVKRYSELFYANKKAKKEIVGRAYQIKDLTQIAIFGTTSAYVSVLIFAFYISSNKVMMLYQRPQLLWSVCLILLFWISRLWMLASRGNVQEDPVLFALKDRTSFVVIVLTLVIMIAATL